MMDVNNTVAKPKAIYESGLPTRTVTKLININQYNKSHDTNVSAYSADLLRSRARHLFANTPIIKSAISEIADFSIGSAFLFKSQSRNKQYKESVQRFVNNWIKSEKLQKTLRLIIKAVIRDGDILVVLSKRDDGYPIVRLISPHQIKNGKHTDRVKGGLYDGFQIQKGVITDSVGDVVAYNVVYEDESEIQIAESDCILVREDEWENQLRGDSALAPAISYFEDVNLVNKFELLGIQNAASIALIAKVPAAQVDNFSGYDGDAPLVDPVATSNSTGKELVVNEKTLRGGQVLVFDDNSNAEFKQLETSRPSQNVQAYIDNMISLAMNSLRWPKEFSVKINLGGTEGKMMAEKIRKRVSEIQDQIVYPVWHRIMMHVVAVATQKKLIPMDEDIFEFTSTYPKEFGIDYLKDTKADIELYRLGILTPQQLAEAQGYDFYENIEEKNEALKFAKMVADRDGTDYAQLIQNNPNYQAPTETTSNTEANKNE